MKKSYLSVFTSSWIFEAKAHFCPIIYVFVIAVVPRYVVRLTMSALRRMRRQSGKRRRPQPSSVGPGNSERIDLDRSELESILERAKTALSEEEYAKLHAAMETLIFLTQELEKKRVSVQRLRQLLFGATTEKTRKVMEKFLDEAGKESNSGDDAAEGKETEARQKTKGHGRNGAEAYTGADKVCVPHESLKPGDTCPNCQKGTVYETAEPGRLVRIRGQAPLGATVYELQKLRCNLCGQIFTAQTPPNVGPDKYDAESASMIALLKYGSGLPFNRLERLQGSLGIPLPAATQWEIVRDSAGRIEPVFEEMIRQAAQGRLFHNDDSATSEGWRVQWETVPPGQKSETCSLDDRQEGNRMI